MIKRIVVQVGNQMLLLHLLLFQKMIMDQKRSILYMNLFMELYQLTSELLNVLRNINLPEILKLDLPKLFYYSILGADSIYFEFKLSLCTLFNKRYSQYRTTQGIVCDADIRLTSSTSLISVNNTITDGIRKMVVYTFF